MSAVLVLHGPNLNLLGSREPEFYGHMTLEEINQRLLDLGSELNVKVRTFQSNHEGALIDKLHEAQAWAAGIIMNPGGYTTTSVALRDAISALGLPAIEVHLSNVHAREEFRRHSMIAPVCMGSVAGLGWRSYTLALRALAEILSE
jgi:3-dehydroquinate dehydratase-2